MSNNPHTDAAWREIWDQAMASAKGIALAYPTKSAAEAARFSLYRARNAERKVNATVYPKDDPLHGASIWDTLRVTVVRDPESGNWEARITSQFELARPPTSIREL